MSFENQPKIDVVKNPDKNIDLASFQIEKGTDEIKECNDKELLNNTCNKLNNIFIEEFEFKGLDFKLALNNKVNEPVGIV